MLHKNTIIQLDIDALTNEGSGVGRHEGMAVFVPFAAVGDRLAVRIVKTARNYCYGIIHQIITPSPDRISGQDCGVFSKCGGCSLRHITYSAELAAKQGWVQDNLRRIAGVNCEVEPIVPSPQTERYRNKAQYPICNIGGRVSAGFYAPRSHRVVETHDCVLHPQSFGAVLQDFLEFCNNYNIQAYDEASHTGIIRHLYIRRGEATDEMMVCAVVNADMLPHSAQLCEMLTERHPYIKSVILNRNTQKNNVILGNDCVTLWGADAIEDIICGLRIKLAPQSFYQVNRGAAELAYRLAGEFAGLTGTETVLDLYCGAGAIGLSMAGAAKEIIGVELVPQAVENAVENARINSIRNARFICSDAGAAAAQLMQQHITSDIVVLDPPRKGCDAQTIGAVCAMRPQKVVMVSCDSATMARDIKAFTQQGYALRRARPVDMFPRTANVECVTLMEKTLDG